MRWTGITDQIKRMEKFSKLTIARGKLARGWEECWEIC